MGTWASDKGDAPYINIEAISDKFIKINKVSPAFLPNEKIPISYSLYGVLELYFRPTIIAYSKETDSLFALNYGFNIASTEGGIFKDSKYYNFDNGEFKGAHIRFSENSDEKNLRNDSKITNPASAFGIRGKFLHIYNMRGKPPFKEERYFKAGDLFSGTKSVAKESMFYFNRMYKEKLKFPSEELKNCDSKEKEIFLENLGRAMDFIRSLNGNWRQITGKEIRNISIIENGGLTALCLFDDYEKRFGELKQKTMQVAFFAYNPKFDCFTLSKQEQTYILNKSDFKLNIKDLFYGKSESIPALNFKEIIFQDKQDAEFLKLEISDDFTEIKEYRKGGENWVLQSVMKKLEADNSK